MTRRKTDLVKLCPTCGRKPSERHPMLPHVVQMARLDDLHSCPDPIHDLADLGPALADVLANVLDDLPHHTEECATRLVVYRGDCDCEGPKAVEKARAILAAARKEGT